MLGYYFNLNPYSLSDYEYASLYNSLEWILEKQKGSIDKNNLK